MKFFCLNNNIINKRIYIKTLYQNINLNVNYKLILYKLILNLA